MPIRSEWMVRRLRAVAWVIDTILREPRAGNNPSAT
jgi:hypothetical protein